MCRTVEDTAAVLEVLTGGDPRDAITAVAHGRRPVVYSNYKIPVAMEFLARPFDEALLFEIASAYEAGTKHRRPPK